jgi:hypothetical protein
MYALARRRGASILKAGIKCRGEANTTNLAHLPCPVDIFLETLQDRTVLLQKGAIQAATAALNVGRLGVVAVAVVVAEAVARVRAICCRRRRFGKGIDKGRG